MSDRDENGRRLPDYEELRDAAEDRRRLRWATKCLCGNPDWPGACPGAANCPVHGETLDDEAAS